MWIHKWQRLGRLHIAIVVLTLLLAACTGEAPTAATRQGSSSEEAVGGVQIYWFESLEEMVETSQLIVAGKVVEVKAGRTVGPADDPEGAIQFQEGTLQVDEVLKGSLPSNSLILEEEPDGIEGEGGSKAGDMGVYFLVAKQDRPSVFVPINSQGKLLIRDGQIVASDPDASWVEEVNNWTPEELVLFILTEGGVAYETIVKICWEITWCSPPF